MDQQLKRDHIYLEVAKLISSLSKDENTKVGCKIMSKNGEPISEGRNGASRTIKDDYVPYSRDEKDLYMNDGTIISSNKYPFMLHAEQNAILFCRNRDDLKGATIYVTHMPCHVCANMISQCGIKRVVIPKGSIVASTDINEQKIVRYIFEQSNIQFDEI